MKCILTQWKNNPTILTTELLKISCSERHEVKSYRFGDTKWRIIKEEPNFRFHRCGESYTFKKSRDSFIISCVRIAEGEHERIIKEKEEAIKRLREELHQYLLEHYEEMDLLTLEKAEGHIKQSDNYKILKPKVLAQIRGEDKSCIKV